MNLEKYKTIIELIKDSCKIDNLEEVELNKLDNLLNITGNFNDFKRISSGGFSTVYEVNKKIIKIGLAKTNIKIITHPRIIKTYLKQNIRVKYKGIVKNIGVEVQDKAEEKKVNQKDLYIIYKELRDNNIIWKDIKESNVGYFKGKLVVIDTDFINNPIKDIEYFTKLDKEFEEIYNKNEVVK